MSASPSPQSSSKLLPSDILLQLPPFSGTSRSRLQALYSDISRQKVSNPTSYHANVEWWRRALEVVVSSGRVAKGKRAGSSGLVLTANQGLLDSLRIEGVGKPLALGAVIPELVQSKALISLPQFLSSPQSIYDPGWLPGRIAWYLVGKPLLWALEHMGVTGDDGMLSHYTGGGRQTGWHGEYVVTVLVERAADEVTRMQAGKVGEGAAGALYSVDGFRKAFASAVGQEEGEERIMDERDAQVLLRYLQRDRRVVVMDKEVIKFVASSAATEAREITAVDRGILELKMAVENMHHQIENIQTRISELTKKASTALRDKQRPMAINCIKSRKQLEDLLGKRLGSLETLESTLIRVEAAAGDIEIMKSYESSTTTLRAILSHPSLQREKIEETMEAMAEATADARDVDEAIKIGGDVALGVGAGGAVEIDESELEEELKMLVEEKMMIASQAERERKSAQAVELRREETQARQAERVAIAT